MAEVQETSEQSAKLLSLPNETLADIAAELPLLRLKTFSTLSKRFRKVAVSAAFESQMLQCTLLTPATPAPSLVPRAPHCAMVEGALP